MHKKACSEGVSLLAAALYLSSEYHRTSLLINILHLIYHDNYIYRVGCFLKTELYQNGTEYHHTYFWSEFIKCIFKMNHGGMTFTTCP
jgi:hypothetical protein